MKIWIWCSQKLALRGTVKNSKFGFDKDIPADQEIYKEVQETNRDVRVSSIWTWSKRAATHNKRIIVLWYIESMMMRMT